MKKTYFATAFLISLSASLLASCDKPTQGERIGKYTNPRSALLVLDFQKDFTSDKARFPADPKLTHKAIHWANWLVDGATVPSFVVVYVRNEFEPGGMANWVRGNAAVKGMPGVAFDERLKVTNQNIFSKNVSDAFSNPAFNAFLVSNRVSRLYVTGLMGGSCVYQTVQGGLNRGYDVRVVEEAVADRSAGAKEKAILKIKKAGAKIVNVYDVIQTEGLDFIRH